MSSRDTEISNTLKHAIAVATGQHLPATVISGRDYEDALFLVHGLTMLNETLTTRPKAAQDSRRHAFFVAACGTKHVVPVIRKIIFSERALPCKSHWREGVDSTVARLDEGYAWNAMGHGIKEGRQFVVIVWKEDLLLKFAETLGVTRFEVPIVVSKVFLKAKATQRPYFYLLAADELTFTTYLVQSRYRLPGTCCEQCATDESPDKPKFLRCGNCRTTLYCSKDCQTKDWVTGGHRERCKANVEAEKMGFFLATTGTSRHRFVPSIVVDLRPDAIKAND